MAWVNWILGDIKLRIAYFVSFILYIFCLFFVFKVEILNFFVVQYSIVSSGQSFILLKSTDLLVSQLILCFGLTVLVIIFFFFD